jgi:hypothetical protein
VLERHLRGEQPAGAVGQLDGQGAAQHPQLHRPRWDRSEPEPLPGWAVDPLPERAVGVLEHRPAEHQGAGLGILVQQLLGEVHGVVDLGDDDPLVGLAAVAAVLEDLPGQPVAGQAGRLLLRWEAAAEPQFEQFAGPHAGGRGDHQEARNPGDVDQDAGVAFGQRKRPRRFAVTVGACDGGPGAGVRFLDTHRGERSFEFGAQEREPGDAEAAEAGLGGHVAERHIPERVGLVRRVRSSWPGRR